MSDETKTEDELKTPDGMGLDDDDKDVKAGTATESSDAPAKDVDGIPYCRKHHCRMKQTSGGKKDTPQSYYGCPVSRCKETAKHIRSKVESVVPAKPLACPRCSTPKKAVHCERDVQRSTAAMVILKCPKCSWKSNGMAVPQLAAAHFARNESEPVEDIGDR